MSMADIQLNANRTMAAYLRAMKDADLDKARAILEGCLTNPAELSMFVECLSGFALATLTIAEGLAAASGRHFDAGKMLDKLTMQLAFATALDDVLPGSDQQLSTDHLDGQSAGHDDGPWHD